MMGKSDIDIGDLPDIGLLVDALRKDEAIYIGQMKDRGHTACPACIEAGFLIAQRHLLRAAIGEDAPGAEMIMASAHIEGHLREILDRRVVRQ